MSDHICNIRWCKQNSENDPHWAQISYTPATMNWVTPEAVSVNGINFPTVGVGIRYDELLGTPAVYVHISGGPRDDDVDAYMRIDEAESVLGALQDAVDLARETIADGTPQPNT